VVSVASSLKDIRNEVELIIIATHWLDPFLDLATRVVTLSGGRVVSDIPITEISSKSVELKEFGIERPIIYQLTELLHTHGLPYDGNQSYKVRNLSTTETPYSIKVASAREITYKYPTGEMPFEAVTFDIDSGSKLALVGPNGAGKSTLSRMLVGL